MLRTLSRFRKVSFAKKTTNGRHFKIHKRNFQVAKTKVNSILLTLGLSAFGLTSYYLIKSAFPEVSAQDKNALDPNQFKSFEIESIKKVNHNTSLIRVKLPNEEVLGLPVSSCIMTKAEINGKQIIRPYTPVNYDEKGHFDLLIKGYETGAMSKHLTELKPGDKVEVKGPIPKLEYKSNMKKEIGMIAGGTGITPMLQVTHKVLSSSDDHTKLSLLFSNRTEEDILLRKEIEQLTKDHKNFKVYHTLSQSPGNWSQGKGHVSKEMIAAQLPPPGPNILIYVCGPDDFVKYLAGPKIERAQGPLSGILKEMGYTEEMVYKF